MPRKCGPSRIVLASGAPGAKVLAQDAANSTLSRRAAVLPTLRGGKGYGDADKSFGEVYYSYLALQFE